MQDTEINQWSERRHFLIKAIEFHNAPDEAAAREELLALEIKIRDKTRDILDAHYDKIREEAKIIKREVKTDGEMKRAIAGALIHILEDILEPSDLKGVFRQGYKLMRLRC